MRKNVLKASAFLLGTALVITSCVKTEELDSVKAIREAKAASLTADANYRNAETQLQLAQVAYTNYTRWIDSAQKVATLPGLTAQGQAQAAQAQLTIEKANEALAAAKLQSQIDLKTLQDSYDAIKNNNPTLAMLVKDFNTYYNGYGTLSSGVYIQKGIYSLKEEILNNQNQIIGLQVSDNSISLVLNQLNDQLVKDSFDLKASKAVLKIYQDAEASGNYASAMTSAKNLEASAYADYIAKYNIQQTALNSSNNAHSLALIAHDALFTAESDSSSNSWYKVTDINSITASLNSYKSKVKQDSLNTITYTSQFNIANSSLQTKSATLDAANATLSSTQATVQAASLNGGTPTVAQQTALTNATTAQAAAQQDYQTASNLYTNAKSALDNATSAYNSDAQYLKMYQDKLTSYNKAKADYEAAVAKLSSLWADYSAKMADYKTKDKNRQTAEKDATYAYTLYGTAQNAVFGLDNVYSDLNSQIEAYQNEINVEKSTIVNDINKIAQTKQNTNATSDRIKTLNDQITNDQALIDNYTAAAAALKTKIDAQ